MKNYAAIRKRVLIGVAITLFLLGGCDTTESDEVAPLGQCNEQLDSVDVVSIVEEGIAQATRLSQNVTIAVSDREGNVLAVFEMTGSNGTVDESIRKARTAAYLSSNQQAFTTLTACFITRPHFPPGVANTPGGPLYGVGFSSLPDGDVQPNAGPLSDQPGGVPLYKNGCLVGAVGVAGGVSSFDPPTCSGSSTDEMIAFGAGLDFSVPSDKRGDNLLIDGIRILFANAPASTRALSVALNGSYVVPASPPFPSPRFPAEGFVTLGGGFDFPIINGTVLTMDEVRRIIDQASSQAGRTRAAIRLPMGAPAQVFISVVDTNGAILGIWRTPDATLFSFDVSAQKARTAVAFSSPGNVEFGQRLRSILGMPPTSGLAVTTRAVGFLAQDFFPPGIDRTTLGRTVVPGPLYEGPNFAYQNRLFQQANLPAFGNGITIFPGGLPLYKNGVLAGAIGVSGDGVDQDDLIAFAGAIGFEPPDALRCDNFSYEAVRLPYVKFPRHPEIP
jgi:uncharacterized protein GlcG (DUF336 family)